VRARNGNRRFALDRQLRTTVRRRSVEKQNKNKADDFSIAGYKEQDIKTSRNSLTQPADDINMMTQNRNHHGPIASFATRQTCHELTTTVWGALE